MTFSTARLFLKGVSLLSVMSTSRTQLAVWAVEQGLVPRLRLSSIDPHEVSEPLVRLLARAWTGRGRRHGRR